MEKYHCAPFDKFSPKLPKETDAPFLAAQNNVKNGQHFLSTTFLRKRKERLWT